MENTAENSRMKIPEKRKKKINADEMFAAFTSLYALSAFAYENDYELPEGFMEIWRTIVFIVTAFAWIIPSFKSGYSKRIAFPVFTVISQALPLLIIFLANDGPRAFKMSITMYALSEFFSFICYGPVHIFTEKFDEYPIYLSGLAVILVCIVSYVFGIITAKLNKKKGNYIPKRC